MLTMWPKINLTRYYFIEILLGVALGTGHLTSLRFLGKIGASEILFLLILLILSIRHLKNILTFNYSFESYLRFVLFATIFIVAPIVTCAVYFLTDYNSSPEYMISMGMNIVLVFLLIEARKDGFSYKHATLWFFFIYISMHIITLFIYPIENLRYDYVYTGGANNPNQIVWYSQSLSLLLAVFYKKFALFFIPVLIYLTLHVNSDAYLMSIILAGLVYTFFHFFYLKHLSFEKNILIYIAPISIISALYILANLTELLAFWDVAGGYVRWNLFSNAMHVISTSPIVGYGVGSFSGKSFPFEGTEAHSNIFDLGTQFGIFFTIAVYFVMLKAVYVAVNRHDFFAASFLIAFLIVGLFHYNARHFIFWVEFSIFYYYAFHLNNTKQNLFNKTKQMK